MSKLIDSIVKDAATGKLAVMDLPGPHPGCRPNAKYLNQAQPPADLSSNTGQPSCEYHRPGSKSAALTGIKPHPIDALMNEGTGASSARLKAMSLARSVGNAPENYVNHADWLARHVGSPRGVTVPGDMPYPTTVHDFYRWLKYRQEPASWKPTMQDMIAKNKAESILPKQASENFIDELIKEADMYGYDPRMMRYAGRNPYMAQAMFNPNTMRQGVQGQQDMMRTQAEIQQQMMAKQFEIEKQRRGLDMAVGGGGGYGGGMGGYGSYMGYGGMPGGMGQFFGGMPMGGVMPGYGPPGGPGSNMPPHAGPPGSEFMNPYMYSRGGEDPRVATAHARYMEADRAHKENVNAQKARVEQARNAFLEAASKTSGGKWIDPQTGSPVAQQTKIIPGSLWRGEDYTAAEQAHQNYLRLHQAANGGGGTDAFSQELQASKAKRDQMQREYDQARAGQPAQQDKALGMMREDQLYNRGMYEKQLEGNRNLQQQRMQLGQQLMGGQPQQPQQPGAAPAAPAAPAPAPAAPPAPLPQTGITGGGFNTPPPGHPLSQPGKLGSFIDDLVKEGIGALAVPMAATLGGAGIGALTGPEGFKEDAAERAAIMGGAAGMGGVAGNFAGRLAGRTLGPIAHATGYSRLAGKGSANVLGGLGSALGALAALSGAKGAMPKAPWKKGPAAPPGVLESWMGAGSPPPAPPADSSFKVAGYEVQSVNPFKSHHNGQPEFGRKRKPLQSKPIGNNDGPDLSEMDEHMQALHLRKHSALSGFTPGANTRLGAGVEKSKLSKIEDVINKFRGLGSARVPPVPVAPVAPVAPVPPPPIAGLSSSRFLTPEALNNLNKIGAAAEMALAAAKSW